MLARALFSWTLVLWLAAAEPDDVCDGCAPFRSSGRAHHWPNARGNVGSYGVSEVVVPPGRVGSPTWSWHHPRGQYSTVVVGGPVIDAEMNLYVVQLKGIHKLSPDGQLLWSSKPDPAWRALHTDGAAVMGDGVYVTNNTGQLCAFATSNGTLLWVKKYYESTGLDTGYVTGHDGVLIIGMNNARMFSGGSKNVVAVNAADGSLLWDFRPDTPTWNNMGMFTGDDSVVFQDMDARVYCLGLHNGTVLWKVGGRSQKLSDEPPYSETWTDGGTIIGADGVVYSASSDGAIDNRFLGGHVHAYRLSDGQLLWEKGLSMAFLTWPVAAKLHGDENFTVFVFPGVGPLFPWKLVLLVSLALSCSFTSGACCCSRFCCKKRCKRCLCCRRCSCSQRVLWCLVVSGIAAIAVTGVYKARTIPRPSEVIAMNAKTGEEKWRFRLPDWDRVAARGDEEGLFQRIWEYPWCAICLPVAFSSPSVDGNGTLFFGTQSGMFYGLKDSDKDGVISPSEVSSFDAEGAFLHSGPAFAPGMMAVTTCDSLHVWRF